MTRQRVVERRKMLGVLAGVTAAVCAILAPCASEAFASGAPAWSIVSISNPTHLETPRNQVDELTVNATGGSMKVSMQAIVGDARYPVRSAEVSTPYNASPEELQKAFEEAGLAGEVKVTGGAGGAGTYRIAFEGALAGQEVRLEAYSRNLEGSASVKVLTPGRSSGILTVTATNVG